MLNSEVNVTNEVQNTEEEANRVIRFDGIYGFGFVDRTLDAMEPWERVKSWYYLRFYPDGQMISVSTTGLPHQIKRWFNLESWSVSEYRNIGTYQYNGKEITGNSWQYERGSQKFRLSYRGHFEGAVLTVTTHSTYNNTTHTHDYTFYSD
jgi:hypothetical protein